MFRGKLSFRFYSILLVCASLCLGASWSTHAWASATSRCNALGTQLNNLTAEAQSLGYFSLAQPLVIASDAISEAQAKAASDQKIAEFQSWLAGAQAMLDNSRAPANCSYRADAQKMIDYGRQTLANLMNFAGPYTKAEAALASSPAKVTGGYSLKVPCRKPGDPESGLRECSAVIRDITHLTESYLQKMTDAVYRGCDLSDTSVLSDPASCQPKNTVETCNYFDGITQFANTSAEQGNNHIGRSCGKWISVGQRVSGKQCMISANQMGTLEQSFFQGNAVRSMDCHWAQLRNELTQGKLTLTAAAGLDPAEKYKDQIAKIKSAQDDLLAHKNIAQVDSCTSDDLNSASAAKQSACMLYTQRMILEQFVARVAAIEVLNRASRSFDRFDAGTLGRGFFSEFKNYLQQNQGISACQGKKSDCNSGSSKYLTSCYQPLFKKFFEARSNSIWNAEVCQ